MHQVQWTGAAVGWDPHSDDLYIQVAAAIESPEVASWLDVHLGLRIRDELGQRGAGADVEPSRSESGAPMYTLTIRGLTGELPQAGAVHAAVEKAISEGEELVERNARIAASYEQTIRQSR